MVESKFKVGQEVYAQSDWFAGSYIPDCFTIRKNDIVLMDGKEVVVCYVKHRRIPILESMLYATEEEAQLHEVERFKDNTIKRLSLLREQFEKVGVNENDIPLIAETDALDTSHKYKVGDVVYGHMDGGAYDLVPESFEITAVDIELHRGVEHNIYKVKGHGSRPAYEEYLYPTLKEALIADLIRFKATLKGELKSIESRSFALGIENKVKASLQDLNVQKYVE